ncbi:MAG: phosphoribosylamine--glycine ligase [Gammaproteobacteria bacterium]|nr:phosphoribosylamine--glycine ligase [Gammaproteobacteria bacterium]
MKKVLIIGQGGREHALAWKLKQSPEVTQVFVAPGNAGTALEPGVTNIDIGATDVSALLTFAQTQKIDLTIVGPEAPLAAGIVDTFQAHGLAIFGPTQKAAMLETSKVFSKTFMAKYHIPTATFAHFDNASAAKHYAHQHTLPLVVKASGLMAGKGVIICETEEEAISAIDALLVDKGSEIVIETFLQGEEVSFIVLTDGVHIVPLATSQDHKRRDEGDKGPNTGGMGAYSPVSWVNPALEEKILNTVIKPALNALAKENTPYCGFLYAGLMISPTGDIHVLEFNCRLGDPETQALLPRLKTDLFALCWAATHSQLQDKCVEWDARAAVSVVLCASGYPGPVKSGDAIHHYTVYCDEAVKFFVSGAKNQEQQLITSGGRVLCISALGQTVHEARARALYWAEQVNWPGKFYRKDIGWRAVARE